MKLSQYRVRSGHYRVGAFVIYGGSSIGWQVRDEDDQIVCDDFRSVRDAIRHALAATKTLEELEGRPSNTKSRNGMTELAEMLRL